MLRDHLSKLPNELIQEELNKQLLVRLPNNGVINPPPLAGNAPPVEKTIAYSLSSLINFPQVSKRYRGLLFDEHQLALAFLRKLLSHAALGEWEQAEAIYKVFPDAVSCRGTICHPNRTYVEDQAPIDIPFEHNPGLNKYENRSAYQIALMNEEYEEAELMGKYMTAEEEKKQFDEIFPDGKIVKYGFDLEHAKKLLLTLMEAIAEDTSINENNLDQMNGTTRAALYAVYRYAKQHQNQEHQIGLVFDANFRLEAMKLYDNNAYKKFGDSLAKYSFWCIRAEEWLAACMPTGYLRAHSQGICNSTFHRRGCHLEDGSSYFAFRRPSTDLPSLHFFVGNFSPSRSAGGRGAAHFQNLCQAKTRARRDFTQRFVRPTTSPYVIL